MMRTVWGFKLLLLILPVACCFGFFKKNHSHSHSSSASTSISSSHWHKHTHQHTHQHQHDKYHQMNRHHRSHLKQSTSSFILHQHSPRGGSQEGNGEGKEIQEIQKEENHPTIIDNEEIVQAQYSLPPNNDYNNNEFNVLLDDEDDNHSHSSCTQGLILMDSFCPYHGGYLSHKAKTAYNAGIVHTLSDYVLNCLIRDADDDNDDDDDEFVNARIPKSDKNIEMWLDSIPFQVMGIICESDSGLDDAEKLGVAIGLHPERHNGYNKARRDKFLMNEVVKSSGLRTVRQQFCSTLEEALTFAKDDLNIPSIESTLASSELKSSMHSSSSSMMVNNGNDVKSNVDYNVGLLGKGTNLPSTLSNDDQDINNQPLSLSSSSSPSSPTYCVVKPCRGVASDDVYFCKNLKDVEEAFLKIHHTPIFGDASGEKHESVLIQEFAKGTEYAIDIVSKNGEHKVAALWRYDKRSINNAPFVYFATEVINAQTETGQKVCKYAMDVLDTLDVKWGLTHVEVILDSTVDDKEGQIGEGPVLVEVNCRQHNTDFVPLTSISVGYNALDMLLAAYLGDNVDLPIETEHLRLEWDELPHLSRPRAYAAIVHLVSYVEGEVIGIDENVMEELENLPSVLALEIYDHFSVGNKIGKTIDIRSDSGWVHLMNDDEEQFIADYNRIVELMPLMFIVN